MRNSSLKFSRVLAVIGLLLIFLGAIFLSPSPVFAKTKTPTYSEYSVDLTYFYTYNSEYKTKDTLIEDKTLDLMFLKLEKSATYLELDECVWESSFDTIRDNNAYSDTLVNATYDTATSDGMTVNTQATSNSAETLVQFKATTNASAVAQYAYTRSMMAWDGNEDGDYSDTADRSYLPLDENIFITTNWESVFEGTDAQSYAILKLVFETTTSTDYTVNLKHFYTSGDAGWDVTTSNGATLDIYDSDDTPIVTTVPLAELLEADSESVNIIGLDYVEMYLYADEASKYIQGNLKNIAIYDEYPAFTHSEDDDDDWDFDSTDEYFTGIDQTDRLYTVITQDTTDTFDNDQELLEDQEFYVDLFSYARFLKFGGVCSIEPTTYEFESESTDTAGMYLTTEKLVFNTTELDGLTTPSNVISVSNYQFNMTVQDDVFYYTDDWEDNLVSFEVNSIDRYQNLKSALSGSSVVDNSEVQYDLVDPDSTTGSVQDIELSYYTSKEYEFTSGSVTEDYTAPTSEVETSDEGGSGGTSSSSSVNQIITIGILFGLTALTLGGLFYMAKRRKK